MATKKAASSAKKAPVKKQATTKKAATVTTVKAVESRPTTRTVKSTAGTRKFGLMRTPLLAAVIAEFLGTFIFAAIIVAVNGNPLYAFFGLAGVVLAVGTISGGYVNPALVIGAWVTKRMSGIRAAAYIVAQILGAMLAYVVLNAYVGAAATDAMTMAPAELSKASILPAGQEWWIVLSEFIGTMIFGFAVAGALREKKDRTAAALTVGLGVLLGLAVAGTAAGYIGASAILNPAVAISLQAINFASIWPFTVYVVGSVLGAVVGFVLYDYLRSVEKDA